MKKVKTVIKMLKTQLSLDNLTPDKKKEYCEDAKDLAKELLDGIWLEGALLGIGALEKTIK